MTYQEAEEYAWELHGDVTAMATLMGDTFAQAADDLVAISDALAKLLYS
jgi:hypothetical protein